MKTVSATDANRQFSSVLKQVSQGEEFLVVSHGKPVATITPARTSDHSRDAARTILLKRLRKQKPTCARTWTRNELYESETVRGEIECLTR